MKKLYRNRHSCCEQWLNERLLVELTCNDSANIDIVRIETMAYHSFEFGDYLVFYCILLSFVFVGLYWGFKSVLTSTEEKVEEPKTSKTHKLRDFLTAYSAHSVLPASLSLFSSYISPTTLIGTPTSVYFRGTQYAVMVIVFILSVTFANFVFVPVFYNLKLKSTLEYLEGRFDQRVRVIAVVLYSVNSLLMMASWLFVPAFALQELTDVALSRSVIFAGAIGVFYTSLGGMRALISADLIHTFIMVISLLSVIIKGLTLLGGFNNVIYENLAHGRLYINDFDPNPFTYKVTFWTVVLGGTFYYSMIYCTYQPVLSRYMPASTLSNARKVLWIQAPLMSTMYLICCFSGVVIFAYYRNCDPFLVKRISRVEEFMPLYASDIGGDIPGFLGFFIAGLFSGSLSSMSSSLNSLATLTFEDIIKRFLKSELGERYTKILVRGVAIFYGLLTMSMVSVISLSHNTLRARSLISNMLGSPLFGVYLLGILNPRSTANGSIIALFTGMLFGLFLLVDHLEYYPGVGAKQVSVSGCPKLYCSNADPLEPGCNPAGNYSEIEPSTKTMPTSATITLDFAFIHRMSYHMGGVFSASVTFIIGCIVSPFTRETKRRQDIGQYLAPFLQQSKEKINLKDEDSHKTFV